MNGKHHGRLSPPPKNDATNYLQTKLENEYLIFIKEI